MTKKRTKQRAPLGNFRLEELGIDVQHVLSDGDTPVDAYVLAEIGYHKFDRCPLCLGSGPMTNEDVPPQSIGRRVMTCTCRQCNNLLGTRVERELLAWHVGALGWVRFSSSGSDIRGSRKAPDILYRTTPEGEFVLILISKPETNIHEMEEPARRCAPRGPGADGGTPRR